MSAAKNEDFALKSQQLEADLRELEAFSYSVCHELRTPLQQILSSAELLLRSKASSLGDEDGSSLEEMIRSAKRMNQLISHLLVFSRSLHKELRKKSFSMDGLLADCRDDLESDLKGRTIAWDIANLPPAFGDQNLIRQVVANLLSNAIKYTRARSEARIKVGCKAENGALIYFIRDNGVGFDDKHYDKLFRAFHRLHTDTRFEGTGIGLAIVQRIIHRHGGEVWAEGVPDQGATFYFTLPP